MTNVSFEQHEEPSSDPSLNRKAFLEKVVKGMAVTGGVVAAPRILDKFLVQSAAACTPPSSNCLSNCAATVSATQTDTNATTNCTDAIIGGGTGVFTTSGTVIFAGGDTLSCCVDTGNPACPDASCGG